MPQDYSYWEHDAWRSAWDVCIVGSGITGLSTGISLLERAPDLRVLIVDRGYVPIGASTRNAGFACFGSAGEILDDIAAMGEEAAIKLVDQRLRGLRKLLERIPEAEMDFAGHGGYELFSSAGWEPVADRLSYLNAILADTMGEKATFRQVEVPQGIRGFDRALFTPHEGQLHPAKMIRALESRFRIAGGHCWTGVDVSGIEDQGDRVVLHSQLMFPIECRQAVVTTNAFAARLLPQLVVQGARNQVLVTSPIANLPWRGNFHFDKGYVYFRNIGDRILLGGARNTAPEAEMTESFGFNPTVTRALEDFLERHLSASVQPQIEYRWSGIIGVGPNKSPIIARISPVISAGVRLSGMGVALASLIGEELSEGVVQQLKESGRLA